jgi:hypothetical protein
MYYVCTKMICKLVHNRRLLQQADKVPVVTKGLFLRGQLNQKLKDMQLGPFTVLEKGARRRSNGGSPTSVALACMSALPPISLWWALEVLLTCLARYGDRRGGPAAAIRRINKCRESYVRRVVKDYHLYAVANVSRSTSLMSLFKVGYSLNTAVIW